MMESKQYQRKLPILDCLKFLNEKLNVLKIVGDNGRILVYFAEKLIDDDR